MPPVELRITVATAPEPLPVGSVKVTFAFGLYFAPGALIVICALVKAPNGSPGGAALPIVTVPVKPEPVATSEITTVGLT